MLPTIWKEPLSSEPWPGTSAKECVSPGSGSPAERAPTVVPTGWFSATLVGESAIPVGARCPAEAGLQGRPDDVLAARVDDVDRIDERSVIPGAADHAVDGTGLRRAPRRRRALAGVDAVVAAGADQHVTPALADNTILAPSAEQAVGGAVTGDYVVAAPALDALDVGLDVVALAGQAVVRPGADRHGHPQTALAVNHDVAPRPTGQSVGPEAAAEDVATRAAANVVGTGAAERPVVAGAALEPIAPRLALQQIAARATDKQVVPALPTNPVCAAEAAHTIIARRARQPVRTPGPGDRTRSGGMGNRVYKHRRGCGSDDEHDQQHGTGSEEASHAYTRPQAADIPLTYR